MAKDATTEFLKKYRNKQPYNDSLIPESEYKALTNKEGIRKIFNANYFADYSEFLSDLSDLVEINTKIESLKKINSAGFDELYKKAHSFGPGERLIYFLVNGAILAGGSSSGDVRLGSTTYEIKAVDLRNSGKQVGNIFTGRAVNTNKIQTKLAQLANQSSSSEIKISVIGDLRKNKPDFYNDIKQEYADTIYDAYFKHHDIIFFNNTKKAILAIKHVAKDDIDIDYVTQNAIKPLIWIKKT